MNKFSAVGSSTYNMAKYVSNILSTYVRTSKSCLKNTADFIEMVRALRVKAEGAMVSFDVKSSFTSVPVCDALVVVQRELEKDNELEINTGVTADMVNKMLKLCLSCSV